VNRAGLGRGGCHLAPNYHPRLGPAPAAVIGRTKDQVMKTRNMGAVAFGGREFAVCNTFSITLEGEPAAWLNAMAACKASSRFEEACGSGEIDARRAFCRERSRVAKMVIEEAVGAVFAAGLAGWEVCPRLRVDHELRPRRVDRLRNAGERGRAAGERGAAR
jgi:hypothetical protein